VRARDAVPALLEVEEVVDERFEQRAHLTRVPRKSRNAVRPVAFVDHQVLVNQQAEAQREVVRAIVAVQLHAAEVAPG
jgi:hypothetical protein